ncbi:MAG: hypothetical protein ACE3JQ_05055 [Paenisporosarcina sp.]
MEGNNIRRSNNGMIRIGFVAISLIVLIFVFSFSFNKESDQDLYLRDVSEVESVNQTLIESKFQEQLMTALKNEGYKPTGSIGFTIYSMDQKEMTIVLHGIDSSKKQAEKFIQQLSNKLSNSVGLGTFKVNIVEDKD